MKTYISREREREKKTYVFIKVSMSGGKERQGGRWPFALLELSLYLMIWKKQ